ncbi:hypothetical protein LSTR_LSTR009610 [Laodelphax striatellus]|uniref:Cap-specific mRNA (nucleoside-2'-O-)-methyltransferase 1 n=1 Tax=Laodelphax striatellus TaxID=195883 RepID=A0A482WIR0_LAOST|nr:hypothetical protein LSTR_LSTR009610 [Laodelphax striatellus]
MATPEFISDTDSSDDDAHAHAYSPPAFNVSADQKSSGAESGDETASQRDYEVQSTSSYTSQATSVLSHSSGYSSASSTHPYQPAPASYQPPPPLHAPTMPSLFDYDTSSHRAGGSVVSPLHYPAFAKRPLEDNGYGEDEDEDDEENVDAFGRPIQRFGDGSQPAKKSKYNFESLAQKTETVFQANPKVSNMMAGMGYSGKGLGKHEQGRVDPIELSKQRGRSGLGRTIKGLESESLTWDSSLEVVSVAETPVWLDCVLGELTEENMRDWSTEGQKIEVMDSFCDFVDPDLLYKILEKKTVFDDLDPQSLNAAVKRANPFETIKHGIFQNRAAMKMANIDKVFGKMFTEPLDHNNKPLIGEKNLLYFADVCAGPGGFSEYVLYRKNWQAKGIGFTLANGTNDFKLGDFLAGTPESFET